MASADQMEREAERRRLAFLQYAASQGFSGTTPVSDIPIMTEAAGPITQPKPDGSFWGNVKGLGSMLYNTGASFIPGTQQSEDLSNLILTEGIQSIPIGMGKSIVSTGSNLVDVLPYVDTKEPGINYINDYREGKLFSTALEDILNAIAVGSVAKAGMTAGTSAVRNNITNPGARFNPYEYGIHVNVPGDLPAGTKSIIPRQAGQGTTVGGDSIPGNSYMWDATQPGIIEGILGNRQMTNTGMFDVLYDNPPAAYFTRSPKSRTGTDINIPTSQSLAVTGSQKVIEGGIPLTAEALQDLFARRRVMEMGDDAALRKIFTNSAKPGVPDAIGDGNATFAYNYIRDKIVRAQGNPNDPLSSFSPDITLVEMLNDPVLYPQVEAFAASRIAGQRMNPPDLIRDEILQYVNENEYRFIIQEAQKLNDVGIPFKEAVSQVLDDALQRKFAGETLPQVVRDSGMAGIGDPWANQRLNMLNDDQIVELIRQLGTIDARKALGNPDFKLWQNRLGEIQNAGTRIPGRGDSALAAFNEIDDAALLKMVQGRANREAIRKQLRVSSQAFYERVNRLLGETE